MTTYYRPRGTVVQAVQWRGDNPDEMLHLAGHDFDVLASEDRANCDDPTATAQLLGTANSRWILLYDGDWVVDNGVCLEAMPDAAFIARYEVNG